MNKIRREDINKEMEILKEILSNYWRMDDKAYSELYKRGYMLMDLGSQKDAYICSKQIRIKELNSQKYLNGEYLVVGICNTLYGGWPMYRGFVKEIVD